MSRCRTVVAQEMMEKSQAIYWLPGDRWNLLATSPRDMGRRLRSRLAVGAREVVTRTLAVSRVFKSPDPYLLLSPCSHQAGVDLIRRAEIRLSVTMAAVWDNHPSAVSPSWSFLPQQMETTKSDTVFIAQGTEDHRRETVWPRLSRAMVPCPSIHECTRTHPTPYKAAGHR